MRGKTSTINTKIGSPGPGFWEFIGGLIIGTILSPVIISVTESGRKYLADLAREKIKR